MRKKTRLLGGRIGFGRLGLPLWAVGLAVIVVGAAAGQAVGPVLSGAVSGQAGLTIEQSVVLGGDSSVSGNHTDDALIVESDEGTSFTAAFEMHVGDTVHLHLDVDNLSDATTANAMLQLQVPAGVDVEVEEETTGADGLDEAQMSRNTWLLKLGTSSDVDDDKLKITISSKDNFRPGFTTITGRIVQIEG